MVKHIPNLCTVEISASWIARVLVVLTVETKAISNIIIWDRKGRLKTGSKVNQCAKKCSLIGTKENTGLVERKVGH